MVGRRQQAGGALKDAPDAPSRPARTSLPTELKPVHRFMFAVEDGEDGEDTGISGAMGINSHDDPGTNDEPSLRWTDDGFGGVYEDLEPNSDEGD